MLVFVDFGDDVRRTRDPLQYQIPGSTPLQSQVVRSFCMAVELMAQVKCYGSILDVSADQTCIPHCTVEIVFIA